MIRKIFPSLFGTFETYYLRIYVLRMKVRTFVCIYEGIILTSQKDGKWQLWRVITPQGHRGSIREPGFELFTKFVTWDFEERSSSSKKVAILLENTLQYAVFQPEQPLEGERLWRRG